MEWTTLQEGLAGQASYSSSACTESNAENTHAHIIGTCCGYCMCFNPCVQ